MTAMLLMSFLVCDAMLVGYLWSMPVPSHREAFFGLIGGAGRPDSRDRQALLAYRVVLIIFIGILEVTASTVIPGHASMLELVEVRLAAFATLLVAGLADYIIFAHLVGRRGERAPNRVASSLRTRRLADHTNVTLEVVVVSATFIPLVLPAFFYGSIPEILPASGPAEWVPKSIRLVFGQSLVAVYLQGLVFILKSGMVRAASGLPAEHTEEHLKLKEESIRTYARMWDMFRVLIAATGVLDVSLLVRTVGQANLFSKIGFVFRMLIGATALVSFLGMMSRLSRLYQAIKVLTGRVYVARSMDWAHWHAGGLVYFNADDPALWLETPVGSKYSTSYTLNLGNPWSYPILLYLGAPPVVLAWFLGVF